ncbi:uncharacterized protein G2W53_000710 [Senna tora]|uniref:Uncharacterized protein n=1 Tax=Senna tora TaxID=362788 RepID=A0A834XE84_9FABA|nr:uncharacterized protein G2W53_000710 [Senna tora]
MVLDRWNSSWKEDLNFFIIGDSCFLRPMCRNFQVKVEANSRETAGLKKSPLYKEHDNLKKEKKKLIDQIEQLKETRDHGKPGFKLSEESSRQGKLGLLMDIDRWGLKQKQKKKQGKKLSDDLLDKKMSLKRERERVYECGELVEIGI